VAAMAQNLIALDVRTRERWRQVYTAKALKANTRAWKRPETRDERIRESIALLAAGKKLGLK
jgi:hypothetical protein